MYINICLYETKINKKKMLVQKYRFVKLLKVYIRLEKD